WPDFQPVVVKENQFLSVDELLEQQHQPKESAATIPALDLVAEGSEKGVSPFNGFVVQPANESVEKKVKQSLQRLEEEQALTIMQPLSVADTKIDEAEE
ncbi:ribonuclease E, partial [Pasteurella multocida subsp. multocida str. Anand1_cattle]